MNITGLKRKRKKLAQKIKDAHSDDDISKERSLRMARGRLTKQIDLKRIDYRKRQK
jgi:hypothetical protein